MIATIFMLFTLLNEEEPEFYLRPLTRDGEGYPLDGIDEVG